MGWEPLWMRAYRSIESLDYMWFWGTQINFTWLDLCNCSSSRSNLTNAFWIWARIGRMLFQHTFIVPKLCYIAPWAEYNVETYRTATVCHINAAEKKAYKVYMCYASASARLCMSVSTCASAKLVQNYLQDRNTPQHPRHPYSHRYRHIHMSKFGPEKISSWSHRYRIRLWIFMVWVSVCVCCADTCVIVCGGGGLRESERGEGDKLRRSVSKYSVRVSMAQGREFVLNAREFRRNCHWPRACLCMYRCINALWVRHKCKLISVQYPQVAIRAFRGERERGERERDGRHKRKKAGGG